jgi:DNA-binding PadR family transcriptional regulator
MTTAEDHLPLTPLSFQILVALADAPRHGYGILKEIEGSSSEPFRSSTGTLYLAIQRLEQQGLIEEDPARPGSDSRRRYYRLTDLGRQVAIAETRRLATLLGVVRSKGLLGEIRLEGPGEALPEGGS